MTRLTCPDCGLPLDVALQGSKPARVNGELVFTAHSTQVTCWTPTCKREGITREVTVFYALTDDEIAQYSRRGVGAR